MKYFAAAVLTLIALQTAAVVWIAVSWELARRQTIAIMEETSNRIVSSEIVREVPVERVPPRAIPGSGAEIVTSKITKIVPNAGSGDPEFITDLEGTGADSVVRDLTPGVYTATISGDTIDLDVRMSTVDGRSRFGWGHTEAVSFSVGDHSGAELYPGRTRITVTPPGADVRWRIRIERLAPESAAGFMVEVVGDEVAIANLSPGLWRVDLLWTSGEQPPNWVWDGSIESVDGFGGGSWGGASCWVIYVGSGASPPFTGARLDPGEVAVTANVPPNFTWAVAFTPFPTGADDDGACL